MKKKRREEIIKEITNRYELQPIHIDGSTLHTMTMGSDIRVQFGIKRPITDDNFHDYPIRIEMMVGEKDILGLIDGRHLYPLDLIGRFKIPIDDWQLVINAIDMFLGFGYPGDDDEKTSTVS